MNLDDLDTLPSIREAVRWLMGQQIITEDNLDALVSDAKRKARAIVRGEGGDGDNLPKSGIAHVLDERIKRELVASIAAGERETEWRKRAETIIGTQRNLDRTIHRTFTHRAYVAGHMQSVQKPFVKAQFPYVLFQATRDTRVRKTHLAHDDQVAHVDSPLAQTFADLLDDWNCRCMPVSLDEQEAKERGVTKGGEAPKPKAPAVLPTKRSGPVAISPEEKAAIAAATDLAGKLAAYTTGDKLSRAIKKVGRGAISAAETLAKRHRQAKENRLAIETSLNSGMVGIDQLLEERDRIAVQLAAAKTRATREEEKIRRYAESLLGVEKQATVSDLGDLLGFNQPSKERILETVRWVQSMLGDRVWHPNGGDSLALRIKVVFRDDREEAGFDNTLYLNNSSPAQVIAHEIAHTIESQTSGAVDLSLQFIERRLGYRASQRLQRLRDLFPTREYNDNEVTAGDDDWAKAFSILTASTEQARNKAFYAGKWYDGFATEILTLGIECLYRNAAQFARLDPVYFKLVIGILRGDLP